MRIIFLAAVIFFAGCNDKTGKQKLNNRNLESRSLEIKKKHLESPVLKVILLENGYDQDTVLIGAPNRVLFEGVITSDPRSGSAGAIEVELPTSIKVIDFEMNKWSRKIEVENSTFLHINKIAHDSIEVVYTQKFGGYY